MLKRNKRGPMIPYSEEIHAEKYRLNNESFEEAIERIAGALADDQEHQFRVTDILMEQRFLPGGRVQAAMGSPRATTAFNCFVSGTVEDSMASIMQRATEAAETMRRGGGIGYNFSRLRPSGDLIKSLDSRSSGPLSFMGIFDAVCQTIASAGHRRGAQMGVLRIDHPDIEAFIHAKHNSDKLTGFNISIGVTDEFMRCLAAGEQFPLVFEGKVYKYVDPKALWDLVMRSTWDWAEPGVIFIDRINYWNNLWYCETIEATNPCGEQPLPPYGACLLGSWNMVKYVRWSEGRAFLDMAALLDDIPVMVRAMDNIIDRTTYPLGEQMYEATNKRRMGLGVTGMANALEALGHSYGSPSYLAAQGSILEAIRNATYAASSDLAAEKGSFPLYDRDLYARGNFILTLPAWLQQKIWDDGIRNSHLLSIAPTGTISLTADNVSSGIEPPFMLEYERTRKLEGGMSSIEVVQDYGYRMWGIEGRTANETTPQQHVAVLSNAQHFVDSAVSKTCNVGDHVTFEEFKRLYEDAYHMGCKGITTFRASGKRYGILNAVAPKEEAKAEACHFDPATGQRSCDSP